MLRRSLITLALSAAAFFPAAAQQFPSSQPIRIIVPFGPGGTTDLLGRTVAEALQKRMNHTVIVENRPGAAMTIGTDIVAKAPADGHTLLLAAPDLVVTPAVRANMPYDVEKLTYLTRIWVQTVMIVTGKNSGINTIQELIAKIKAKPGEIRHATYGVGSINHFGSLRFDAAIGGKTIPVPYGGQGPASIDTASGQVEFFHGAAVPFLDSLKPLASSGNARHPKYPDLPTLAEVGYKDADWGSWFGFLAPAGLPQPIADRLITEINAVMKEPEVIEKLRKATGITQTEAPLVGEVFRKMATDELRRWKDIAAREKIVVQ
jgi:tripartite-type tricarboxylate transporter receptor subunit TctC